MDLLRKIHAAGVVGAGGAGFPTHIKLNCKVEYLIINGAECEPLLKSDQYLMRNKSSELVAAAGYIGESTGAAHIIFALKKKYVREGSMLRSAIEKSGSGIEIFFLEGIYPAGDEQILVYEVTGRTVSPGGIPLSVGVVVSNVNTVFNISEVLSGRPVTSRYVTVTGEVRRPVIVKAPLGTPVQDCINAAGGTHLKSYNVIMGGPMMGKMLGMQQARERFTTKTDGGIIVIPEDHYLARRSSLSVDHMLNQAKSACIQCSYCTDMCPRYLIGHKLRPNRVMRALAVGTENDDVLKEALICSECGVCEMYACPMGLSPRKMNIYVKSKLRDMGIKYSDTGTNQKNSAMRAFRAVPLPRLESRIDVARYDRQVDDEVCELHPERVCIPLRQHIGTAAAPVVSPGEEVREGRLIAEVAYEGLGANIHASIDGTIEEVNCTHIIIKAAGSR